MSICVENVSCVYSKGSPFEKVALEISASPSSRESLSVLSVIQAAANLPSSST